jgi:hypothetical protein
VVSQDSKCTVVTVLKKDRSLNVINEHIHPMSFNLQFETYPSDVVNLFSGSLDEIVDSVASQPCMKYPCTA